ncbi:hypothetical protein K505DRAFT_74592 [Melanomma pulvis-pyrius CBS 109.77]|uniref:Yeast cell wall synthesis Kre9/Knh1-like N-terminal domain-containing protein n=1 Tax=Melanomma pulvis-pyrius CBS 109.77 TaxID=1314802 RepID=A0A6A6X3G2_9PLEO|nr:hypothetical protein K505DRAFT_74592 [Melanomma pulvis-pyrius CBS 109.77]
MRFFQTLFAGAAVVAAAAALEINNFPKAVEPGKTYTVTYSPVSNTPTTFILRQGANEDLKTVTTLTTTATNGKFDWIVDDSLPNAKDYALEIKQGDVVNYIGPIGLTGSDATSAAPSSSSTAAPTSSATTAAPTTASVTSSASGSVSSSVRSNSTIASATLSSTASGTPRPSSTTTGGGVPESTGAASTLGSSPIAIFFGAVAAMAYFN